jgi:hypothetical protein
MSEVGVVEIRYGGLVPLLYVGVAALWAVNAVLNVMWFGLTSSAFTNLLLAVVWVGLAAVYRRAYVRATPEYFGVRVAPLRSIRQIPWTSVSAARRSRAGTIELGLAEGETIKLAGPGVLGAKATGTLLAMLEQHVTVQAVDKL